MKPIVFILLILTNFALYSQIQINEFCASNSSVIEDPKYKDYSDWIELHNTTENTINLKGYYLTDNISNADKWFFADDFTIEANGYVIVWADGMDVQNHTNFKLSAEGEELALYSPNDNLIDSLTFNIQKPNVSYGRSVNDNENWGYFRKPTPGAANNTTQYKGFVNYYPDFSIRGGFYNAPVNVNINSLMGGEIRYTTDGSEPEINSSLYTTPITATSTQIIRARVFKPDYIPGPIVTQTYFINENSVNAKLPVISLASNTEHFWDANDGIYVQNFKPLWEVPVNVEFFENNGADRAAFNEPAGCKVNGLWSWQLPQKMLGVYFKKQYGSGNLNFPIFSQRKRSSYKSFALRASGSDWSYTLFRDVLGQHATLLNMDIDIMSFRPAVVYLNGDFLGIHNIREKVDDDYIEKSYNIEPGSFDLIENEDFAEAGNLDEYNHLAGLLNRDLSNQENFDAVADEMDIENFTDYLITEITTANTSISHNVMAWKPKGYSKWRWVLMDLDRGFFNPSEHMLEFYLNKNVWPFRDLFDNANYRAYFAKRLSAHLYTSFYPKRMIELINKHEQLIEDEIPRHVERWLGTTSDYGNALPSVSHWVNAVNNLRVFAQERPTALLADLQYYDFDGLVNLSMKSEPEDACTFYIDGLKSAFSNISGPYLQNAEIELLAKSKPGYNFKGWQQAVKNKIIEKYANWQYNDSGTAPDNNWVTDEYESNSWNSGQAPLGYGQNTENTVLSFGPDSDSKYISYYFRKLFTLSETDLMAHRFVLKVLKDDGAVIYLNGTEIARLNMQTGTINNSTKAASNVSGLNEFEYTSIEIDKGLLKAGENILAIEVHQRNEDSADLSFDAELFAYTVNQSESISQEPSLNITTSEDIDLIAIFEESADCMLPEIISDNLTLTEACSPYLAKGNVLVTKTGKLTIEPGVEIWMPDEGLIEINGSITAIGTEQKPITFKHNPYELSNKWGILKFKNTTDTSRLKHVIIEDASQGEDPTLEKAAISAFNSVLVLDNLTIENVFANPISARYSDITLRNSQLYSAITGDLINVKYGKALVENCKFTGNNQPDTDAIDYDEIENGIIRNCEIINLHGSNSDAVDIGEEATNILIDSLWVNSITDKGVSVGQRSTVTVKNSLFVNCSMGIAVKDSSHCTIQHCTFYNNPQAIACFEKNIGKAGGNATVKYSILSNSPDKSAYADQKSTLVLSNNLSDTDELPGASENIFGDPQFRNPTYYDFNTTTQKQGRMAPEIGTAHPLLNWQPTLMIVQFFVNPLNKDFPEFIAIYNPHNQDVDISGYAITKGVTAEMPNNTFIKAYDTLYITNDSLSPRWFLHPNKVIQWSDGKLSNNGESIQLENPYGIVIDYISYTDSTWPSKGFTEQKVIKLKDASLDNHFAKNWDVENIDNTLDTSILVSDGSLLLYPNPSAGIITLKNDEYKNETAYIYTASGKIIRQFTFSDEYQKTINLSHLNNGIYFVRMGSKVKKLILMK